MPGQNGWTPVKEPSGWTLVEPAKHEAATPAPEERSVGGFLGNLATSGGRFIKDTASGLVDATKFFGDIAPGGDPARAMARAEQAKEMFRNAPRIISAAGSAVKKRYGGVEQIKDTLYNDPVGVASDISTIMMPAKAGLKAGGFAKLAGVAGAVGEATNPMRAVGAVVEPLAHGAANLAVRSTLRPSAAVRSDFGGSKAIADAVLKDRVYSDASAQRKLTDSVAQADSMIADAQAAGAPGMRRAEVVGAVLGEPVADAKLRTRLGEPDATPELRAAAKGVFRNNPRIIPPVDAQAMKRKAQQLAYEAGVDNNSIKKAAKTAEAKALRAGVERSVPEVGPVNERSQRLIGSQQAFQAAEDRPRALTNMLSILGGGAGFAGLGPAGAVAVPMLMKAADSPRVGALAGIGMNEFGRGMNANSLRQAALVARLMGQVPEE
jgi:hypothetical protein